MRSLSIYAAAALLMLWGAAHIIIPTRGIVEGFGAISEQNRRIILMEWLMEGVLLVFIGALVAVVTALSSASDPTAVIVYRSSALTLLVMAGVSLFTGARTAMLPTRLCPVIFTTAAALLFLA